MKTLKMHIARALIVLVLMSAVFVMLPELTTEVYGASVIASSDTFSLTDDWTLTVKANNFSYDDVIGNIGQTSGKSYLRAT